MDPISARKRHLLIIGLTVIVVVMFLFQKQLSRFAADLLGKKGTIHIGGQFSMINGQQYRGIAKLDNDTGLPTGPVYDVEGTVNTVAFDYQRVFIGGTLAKAGNGRNTGLGFLRKTDGRDIGCAIDVTNPAVVYALLSSGQARLYIGGSFTRVNGGVRNRIAEIDVDACGQTDWAPSANGAVRTIVRHPFEGDTLIIGGDFTEVNGESHRRLATLDLNGGGTHGRIADANGTVLALETLGATLFMGGTFRTIDGQPRLRLAAYDLQAGEVLPFATAVGSISKSSNEAVNVIEATEAGTVYIGGQFATVGGVPRQNFAALDADTGDVLPCNPAIDGTSVMSVLADEEKRKVYVGGRFTTVNGQVRNFVASIDMDSCAVLSWNANPSDAVYTLAIDPYPTEPGECGNAIVEDLEECDDGNAANGDGCSAACALEPIFAIGDRVWADANGNGRQDSGERGLPGEAFALYAGNLCQGTPLASAVSSTDGTYAFPNLKAGMYSVQYLGQNQKRLSPAHALPDTLDSDFDTRTKCTVPPVTLGPNTANIDLGIVMK